MRPEPPAPLAAALRDVLRWTTHLNVPCALVGGVAASLLGRPRATQDVDLLVLVEEQDWGGLFHAAGTFNLEARVPDALALAATARVLLLRHATTGVDIDVTFALLPFEREVIARARTLEAAGIRVPLSTPEDLVIMKIVANRPRDRADVEGLLDAHPELDRERVRRWAGAFARALDSPEILDRLDELLAG